MVLPLVAGGIIAGGALAGGLGFLGDSPDEQQKKRLDNEFRNVGSVRDYMSGNIAGTQGQVGALQRQIAGRQMSGFRGGQQALINQLQVGSRTGGAQAEQARLAAQGEANRGIRRQLAMQASQRGAGATLGARGAASNAANITGQAGQQAMLGKLAAMSNQQAMLGGVLQGARGQDQGFMQLGQQGQLEALRQQAALAQLEQQGLQARENARTQRFGAIAGVPVAPNKAQQLMGLGEGLMGAGGTMLGNYYRGAGAKGG